jgi:hypothetical protein
MGEVNLNEGLKELILLELKKKPHAEFSNLDEFVNLACKNLLSTIANDNLSYKVMKGICKQSGLNWLNLQGSGYLVNEKHKIPEDLPFDEQIDKHLENLGLKEVRTTFDKDTYYGLLIDFAWHSLSMKSGTQFSPINYKIDELIRVYPTDEAKLRAIKRRLVFILCLGEEIEYIQKRYDFEKIPLLMDWLTNKFERFATLVAETCLLSIEYYHDKQGSRPNRMVFENFVNYIKDVERLFNSINTTLNGYLIITLRNKVVHTTGYNLSKEGETIIINIPEISIDTSFGVMEAYIQEIFNSTYKGKKICGTDIIIHDAVFPHISLKYRIGKKARVDWRATKLIINLDLKNYIKMSTSYTFLLANKLFEKILTQNEVTAP